MSSPTTTSLLPSISSSLPIITVVDLTDIRKLYRNKGIDMCDKASLDFWGEMEWVKEGDHPILHRLAKEGEDPVE